MTTRSAFKFAVILALVFALAGGYGVFTAKASMKSASSVLGGTERIPTVVSPVEKLAKTVIVQGESGAFLPTATFTLIDGATISCPAPCSFQGDNWLQVLSSATSNLALLTAVDGNFIGLGRSLRLLLHGQSAFAVRGPRAFGQV